MKEKINLQELTALLSEKTSISKKDADAFLREFFGLMTDALIEDKIVKIRNLGTFKLSEVEARESIDVRNGNRLVIPAHTKVSYVQDKELSEIINKPHQDLESGIIEEAPPQEEESIENIEKQDGEQTVTPINTTDPDAITEDASQTVDDDDNEGWVDERKQRRRKNIRIFIFTFLTIAALLAVFRFWTKEPETINYPVLTKPVSNIEKEKENNMEISKDSGNTGEIINPADTLVPIKEASEPLGKKRKTKVGERLTSISFDEYGDVVFWIYIYEENKHLISRDNYVKAGVDIIIPPPGKYDINAKDSKSLQKARDFAKIYGNDNSR